MQKLTQQRKLRQAEIERIQSAKQLLEKYSAFIKKVYLPEFDEYFDKIDYAGNITDHTDLEDVKLNQSTVDSPLFPQFDLLIDFQKFIDEKFQTPLKETQKDILALKQSIHIFIKNPQKYLEFRKRKYLSETDERILSLRNQTDKKFSLMIKHMIRIEEKYAAKVKAACTEKELDAIEEEVARERAK